MTYDPNWTRAEAEAATDAAIAAGQDLDERLPSVQWAVHHELLRLEQEFLAGKKNALLHAIRECSGCDMVLPKWVTRAFDAAYDRVLNYETGSWDEAFGKPYPKGKHLNALRKQSRGLLVWWRVNEMRLDEIRRQAAREGYAITRSVSGIISASSACSKPRTIAVTHKTLPTATRLHKLGKGGGAHKRKTLLGDIFPAVAKEFGLNTTLVNQMYYQQVKLHPGRFARDVELIFSPNEIPKQFRPNGYRKKPKISDMT